MEENENNNKLMENIIGILLILPVYIILFFSKIFVNFARILANVIENEFTIISLAMYGFIILGIFLAYKKYNYKIKEKIELFKTLCIVIAFFAIISIVNSFMGYAINGVDSINCFLYALFSNFIIRIVSTIFYGKFFSAKKAIILYIIYVLTFVFCLTSGIFA